MKSLKKVMATFILWAPFALLPAGCAMDVDDSEPDDSASMEASESQAMDVELQTADIAPDLETQQFGHGRRCRERCWREYRRCERFDHGFDRDGRRFDHCRRRYQRCLSFCRRGPGGFDHGGPGR